MRNWFWLVHVAAIDGYSEKVVSWSCMPVKNNGIICRDVYRKAAITHGMWDQIRVDKGGEFYLSLFVQELFANNRTNMSRTPYGQSKSTMNTKIERIWVEVNNRINYPIKAALVDLCDKELIFIANDTAKFCVSMLLVHVGEMALTRFFNAWNYHRIPGKGIPNVLAQAKNHCFQMPSNSLPTMEEAYDLYNSQVGSALTKEALFGENPFPNDQIQSQCEREFNQKFPDPLKLVDAACNENYMNHCSRWYYNTCKRVKQYSMKYMLTSSFSKRTVAILCPPLF